MDDDDNEDDNEDKTQSWTLYSQMCIVSIIRQVFNMKQSKLCILV